MNIKEKFIREKFNIEEKNGKVVFISKENSKRIVSIGKPIKSACVEFYDKLITDTHESIINGCAAKIPRKLLAL